MAELSTDHLESDFQDLQSTHTKQRTTLTSLHEDFHSKQQNLATLDKEVDRANADIT